MNRVKRYYDCIWVENYNLMAEYYNKHKNTDISETEVIDGHDVGKWWKKQREYYRKGVLSDAKIELLDKFGKNWHKLRVNKLEWEDYYKLLENYKKEHGNINMPFRYEVDGIKLGAWFDSLKYAYNGKNERKLSQTQIILLNRLDPNWMNVNRILSWPEYYKLLEKYYDMFGNITMRYNTVFENVKLGNWLRDRNYDYKTYGYGKVQKPEMVIKLNSLENDWNKKQTRELNKVITNMEIYNEDLIDRTKRVLRDLTLEGINEINSKEEQESIEKELIKRIWR